MTKTFWKIYNLWANIVGRTIGVIGLAILLVGLGLLFAGLFIAGEVDSWEGFNRWARKLAGITDCN